MHSVRHRLDDLEKLGILEIAASVVRHRLDDLEMKMAIAW
ncbi:hypothetical protein J559_2750 [Acinetobacter sp. 983759]|nr:hypothetical protein J559_2750 [Acinetobacter sp. 983759]